MKRVLCMAVVIASTFALGAIGCKHDEDDPSHDDDGDSNGGSIADVRYEGGATDEALESLLGLAASPADFLKFNAPAAGAVLSKGVVPTFTWNVASASLSPTRRSPQRNALAFGTELGHLLGIERVAHAHGAPVNGTASLLEFKDGSGARLVRVFTALTTYAPAADDWAKINTATGPITVTLTAAVFDANKVTQGPFSGTALTFTVE